MNTKLLLIGDLVVRDSSLSRLGGIVQNDNYGVFGQTLSNILPENTKLSRSKISFWNEIAEKLCFE
ncbi:MAG: hypothetical protein ACE5HI_12140 [bacterium]